VMFPARAFAFVKAMKLPGPPYNDVATGGYLAWDRAVDGGVYIDGRLEVYDVDFFSNYIRGLSDPAHWQADVDARGIQTVVFLHWWPNHRPLIRHLLGDRRWALVYFDEVVLVLIRREGHAELIARCADTFGPLRQQIADDLLKPVSSWQWPVGRVRGLGMYAALLDLAGKPDEAVRFYSRLLELRPPARDEGAVELRLAQYHAGKGEMSLARLYLRQAAQADPTNPGIATLAARLGQ
jgi:tetratricopeptide (TPR) repeat protein